ncbi:hypothetical protein BC828DRAFT_379197 [Blastocladiella britannica]|nr:hypothetical protein BC828DRAFT_379197 [Blastocladiella britannica]
MATHVRSAVEPTPATMLRNAPEQAIGLWLNELSDTRRESVNMTLNDLHFLLATMVPDLGLHLAATQAPYKHSRHAGIERIASFLAHYGFSPDTLTVALQESLTATLHPSRRTIASGLHDTTPLSPFLAHQLLDLPRRLSRSIPVWISGLCSGEDAEMVARLATAVPDAPATRAAVAGPERPHFGPVMAIGRRAPAGPTEIECVPIMTLFRNAYSPSGSALARRLRTDAQRGMSRREQMMASAAESDFLLLKDTTRPIPPQAVLNDQDRAPFEGLPGKTTREKVDHALAWAAIITDELDPLVPFSIVVAPLDGGLDNLHLSMDQRGRKMLCVRDAQEFQLVCGWVQMWCCFDPPTGQVVDLTISDSDSDLEM